MDEIVALPDRLYKVLSQGTPAALVTVGTDGYGNAVMTWARALTPQVVRFCVDLGTSTEANVRREGKAALHILGGANGLGLIKGRVRLIRDRVQAAPFGMAMWEMAIAHVKDQSFGTVTVTPPRYQWLGPQADDLVQIEKAVLRELREFTEGR